MAAGRPAIFKDPKELEEKIAAYFAMCERDGRPETFAGLGVWLDVDRKTVYNYAKKDEFFHTMKKARNYILAKLEEKMASEGRAGQIFLAKNYGYTDRQEMELTGSVTVKSEMIEKYLKDE